MSTSTNKKTLTKSATEPTLVLDPAKKIYTPAEFWDTFFSNQKTELPWDYVQGVLKKKFYLKAPLGFKKHMTKDNAGTLIFVKAKFLNVLKNINIPFDSRYAGDSGVTAISRILSHPAFVSTFDREYDDKLLANEFLFRLSTQPNAILTAVFVTDKVRKNLIDLDNNKVSDRTNRYDSLSDLCKKAPWLKSLRPHFFNMSSQEAALFRHIETKFQGTGKDVYEAWCEAVYDGILDTSEWDETCAQ